MASKKTAKGKQVGRNSFAAKEARPKLMTKRVGNRIEQKPRRGGRPGTTTVAELKKMQSKMSFEPTFEGRK